MWGHVFSDVNMEWGDLASEVAEGGHPSFKPLRVNLLLLIGSLLGLIVILGLPGLVLHHEGVESCNSGLGVCGNSPDYPSRVGIQLLDAPFSFEANQDRQILVSYSPQRVR